MKKWIMKIINNTDKNQSRHTAKQKNKNPCISDRSLGTRHWTNSIKIMNRNNYSMTPSGTDRSNWQVGSKSNKVEITTVSLSLRSFTCWSQLAPDHEYKLEHALSCWMKEVMEAKGIPSAKNIFLLETQNLVKRRLQPHPGWCVLAKNLKKHS